MERRKVCPFAMAFLLAVLLAFACAFPGFASAAAGGSLASPTIVKGPFKKGTGGVSLEVDGVIYKGELPVTANMEFMVSAGACREMFGISVLVYQDGRILLQKGTCRVDMWLRKSYMQEGQQMTGLLQAPYQEEDETYLPLSALEQAFEYDRDWPLGSDVVCLRSRNPYDRGDGLPQRYDYRDVGRLPEVKDQGEQGTCWSFASLTALESSELPQREAVFSPDHMTYHNSFSLSPEQGGEYAMSMAYLLAWQGPVLEEEDPYGDGFSPEGLSPSVHVQGARIIPQKDYQAIKKAVFLYGGVQSSLYTYTDRDADGDRYYNMETNSYCYTAMAEPNHDVVIVGWDDTYPKENFSADVEGDGAFLCLNSWGEEFGDGGCFYVSYYDSQIGNINVVYTEIEDVSHYDSIYQSDLCGWVGQAGYGKEDAYAANVYQAGGREVLKAAGFYATGEETSYKVYVALDISEEEGFGAEDFENGMLVAEGSVECSGYYTIEFQKDIDLKAGQRFAVILYIWTANEVHPLAVEYAADEVTAGVDIKDGEGYISTDGEYWESVEEAYQCNLCLKAYTVKREK